jgi:hypothetical protein
MYNSERPKYLEFINNALRYMGFYKVLFLFAMGCIILFTDFFHNFINTPLKKISFGSLFIIYAVYRGYTVYKQIRINK